MLQAEKDGYRDDYRDRRASYPDAPLDVEVWVLFGVVSALLLASALYADRFGVHGALWRNSNLAGIGLMLLILMVRRPFILSRLQIYTGGIFWTINLIGGTLGWYEFSLRKWMGLPIAFDNITHTIVGIIYSWTAYRMAMYYVPFARPRESGLMERFRAFSAPQCAALAILTSLACGALWEMIEFGGYVLFHMDTVGGYKNNMLDLYYNLLGASIGAFVMTLRYGRDERVYGLSALKSRGGNSYYGDKVFKKER